MSTVDELKFIWNFLFSDITSEKKEEEIEEEKKYEENIILLKKLMRTENIKFEQKYNASNILEKLKEVKDVKYEDILNQYGNNFLNFLKQSFENVAEEIQINDKIKYRRNELIKQDLNNKLQSVNANYNLEYINLNKCLGTEDFENQLNVSLKFNSLKDILSKLLIEMKEYENQYNNLTEMDKFLDVKIYELENYLNKTAQENS
ncbi:conserved Plasmodium protein, unknown function [Plasmodium knowlesi strain H]|uniref:Uncharacterized protein n=3 Tax=Plasmodium knowlesi TaxID=5850 RepID=A0A5K1U6Y1_PLAKH|nr:conserved Plasmodium protein, unknown function [Plasmodium knowlesi strain H]OTN65817.1 Uncharacterized protein PKNOH_S100031000 [Plasmodium knowlesi]CAA9987675.1 conserved Plasmodium protein, unknown function [Plasmodium knowlesi strain H]SBO26891.1 conserved Plasmodium protein, unknown function [Plasmodium knowlesi strain H]SBO29647.1 conserved Plasmodium protein, unknown function [Plasmodium knowlesi strain H]VVS77149.1 conserved Plasmodium protein, unknown function [Plasmodium knowlesi |eukprot:XP_002258673.1 hypothetical protein, conserved in Plasmodium species [Plasmodium knowlesi strain H]